MRRLFFGALLAASVWLFPAKSYAIQFSLPFVTQQSTTVTNASLVLSTAAFPAQNTSNYMNCLQHYTVESNAVGAQFLIVVETSTLTAATTPYIVTLSSGVPYDVNYGTLTAYCGPPNNLMLLKVTSGVYTISGEAFVTQGNSP